MATGGTQLTCFVTTSGETRCAGYKAYRRVKCWGSNAYRQRGDGTSTQRNTPVDVLGRGIARKKRSAARVKDDNLVDAKWSTE